MKKIVLALSLLIFSCSTQDSKKEKIAFEQVLEAYYQESLSLYKINAT